MKRFEGIPEQAGQSGAPVYSNQFAALEESPARQYILAGKKYPSYESISWETAPLTCKLYRYLSSLRLPPGYERSGASARPERATLFADQFGQILADIYGITRLHWTLTETYNALFVGTTMRPLDARRRPFKLDLLRPVASGGGLFPCELYVLVGEHVPGVPPGVYHYDAFHHALDPIRRGSYLSVLQTSLAEPGSSFNTSFALIFSCFFWKNIFKYGEFGYRLHCLDLGLVMAQSLEVARRYNLQGMISYQFIDRMLNDLLGLDQAYESVYAVANFHAGACKGASKAEHEQGLSPASTDLATEPAARGIVSVKAPIEPIDTWPLLGALHSASMMHRHDSFRAVQSVLTVQVPPGPRQLLSSGESKLELLAGLRRRHSTRHYFMHGSLHLSQLTQLLLASARGYASDVDGWPEAIQHTLIYCIVNNVSGLNAGVYCFTPVEQALVPIYEGDVQNTLQQLFPPVASRGLYHICAHLFLVGSYEDGLLVYGDRWYRMQNMEAGIIIQRMYLAAAALGLGCDTTLTYPVDEIDRLLRLPAGFSSLAQVMLASEWTAGQYYEQPL